jgi:hypothetical protein
MDYTPAPTVQLDHEVTIEVLIPEYRNVEATFLLFTGDLWNLIFYMVN